ncbi:MAG: peptidoglycan editing factor PgeF [Chlamydiales bacterium]|nr:peptidoglycan editing factor PgeF [Chlamydiales bacterium]
MKMAKPKLEWLEYELLTNYPHVRHGVFSRHGGVSEKEWTSLNLGAEDTFDNPKHTHSNRELVRNTLGAQHLIFPKQHHGAIVQRITAKNLDKLPVCDALFTTEKNVALGVTHADCQGTIFYDPVHEAIAVAHAGWRGSSQNLYARVIDTMRREIGTQAHNLIVCISPSLGPDHAEFKNYRQELPQEFWPFQIKPYYFNFWAISKMQLLGCGVAERNIEMTEICTACCPEDYFSYRRNKDAGRNATIAVLSD